MYFVAFAAVALGICVYSGYANLFNTFNYLSLPHILSVSRSHINRTPLKLSLCRFYILTSSASAIEQSTFSRISWN